MRIPREFREQHRHIPRYRVSRGGSPIRGWPPLMRTPWECSCGAKGREGGAGGHRDHVVAEFEQHEIRRTAYEAWQAGPDFGRRVDLDDIALRAAAQWAQLVGDGAAERKIDGVLAARGQR